MTREDETWTVAVTVPMRLPDEMKDSLFTLVADIAHEWEPAPEERDGWDVDVTGYSTAHRQSYPTQWAYDQACAALGKHRQRAERAEAKQQAVADLIARARRRPGNAFVPIELLEIAVADQPSVTTEERP